MEKGSGQFLLLDDALRVKGRCTKRLCEHPGDGEPKVCIGPMRPKKKYFEKLQRNFFCNCFTISKNKIS